MAGLHLEYDGTTGNWECYAFAEDSFFFEKMVFFSMCPLYVSRDKRPAVAELLHRINYSLLIGNCDMDVDTGTVRCRTSVEAMEDNLHSYLNQ